MHIERSRHAPSVQCFSALFLPPKHCHTTDIAEVTSLLPRGNSNFTAQYFKSNMFSWFCKQVCQLFSSVNMFHFMFYPHVGISSSHRSVAPQCVSTFCDTPGSWLVWWHWRCRCTVPEFFWQSQATVLTAGASARLNLYPLHLLQWSRLQSSTGLSSFIVDLPKTLHRQQIQL